MNFDDMKFLVEVMGKSIIEKIEIENKKFMKKVMLLLAINNLAIGAILLLVK